MLSLGITQINHIISEQEREDIKKAILDNFNNKMLNDESNDNHYKNSYGGEVHFNEVYDRLTEVIKSITGLNIVKANSYSRIYFNDSILKPHVDREGLDLTLSIQIDNTFGKYCPIFGKGYDGTVYQSDLNNGDSVLIKGKELEHWRDEIKGDGYLMCIFFHWTIQGIQYQEHNNFLDADECKSKIETAENEGFVPSAVLQDYDGSKVDVHSRSSHSYNWTEQGLNEKMKPYIGNLKLETWQLIKYNEGDQFLAHYDNGGHLNKRLFTILIYLNDDFEGGTTTFTNQNIIIKPETGKMIIFKNLNGTETDSNSMHSGDKLIKGTKYVLINWANYLD